jgi:hypothetical protein
MFAEQGWLRQVCRAVRCIRSGGCGFARHGTYARVSPPGTLIARWYCPEGHRTFSLLPDWFAARLSGQLCEVEAVVRAPSRRRVRRRPVRTCVGHRTARGAALDRRRVQSVHTALHLLKGLLPEDFGRLRGDANGFGERLEVADVLVRCAGSPRRFSRCCRNRSDSAPAPAGGRPHGGRQHRAGADPPGAPA